MSTTARTPSARVSALRALSVVLAFTAAVRITCKTTSRTAVGGGVDRKTVAGDSRVARRTILAIATAVGPRPSSAATRGSTTVTRSVLGSKRATAAAQPLPVSDRLLRRQHIFWTRPERKLAATEDRTSTQTA